MKTIIFAKPAAKEFDLLPSEVREAILKALTGYAITGEGDVKALSGRKAFRLRVGDYRVLFDEDRMSILSIHFGRRSTVIYRRN